MMTQQPSIGVSACLLGQSVRYDGQHKYHDIAAEYLGGLFQLIPICPEVESGMAVPRPKIQLTQINEAIILQGVDHPQLDATLAIKNQAKKFLLKHKIAGMVLKDQSPSCGINNAKVFNAQGEQIGFGNGLFAETLIILQADLPLIQANELHNPAQLKIFIEHVLAYHSCVVKHGISADSVSKIKPNDSNATSIKIK